MKCAGIADRRGHPPALAASRNLFTRSFSDQCSPMRTWKASLCALVFLAEITCGIQGHTIACDSASAESEEDRLAREVEDPTAILTQLQFQDLYTPRNFQTSAQT